jgi:hypothetical protein
MYAIGMKVSNRIGFEKESKVDPKFDGACYLGYLGKSWGSKESIVT